MCRLYYHIFINPDKILKKMSTDSYLVIFTHGLYGSKLILKKKHTIYPPSKLKFLLGCLGLCSKKKYYSRMDKYLFDPDSGLESNKILTSYLGKSIYKNFFKSLNSIPNLKLVTFAYDWRKSTIVLAEEFANYISILLLRRQYENHKIILIGHSMGGHLIRLILETSLFPSHEFIKSKVRLAIFCAVPFFGHRNLYNVLRLLKLEYNNDTSVSKKTLRYFDDTLIIDDEHQMKLLKTFKINILSLLKLEELPVNSMSLDNIAASMGIEAEYFKFIFNKCILPLDNTLYKPANIKYMCIYNLYYFEKNLKINLPQRYGNDGCVTTTVEDIEKMNKTFNIVQFRLFDKLKHSEILNDDKIQMIIKLHIQNV